MMSLKSQPNDDGKTLSNDHLLKLPTFTPKETLADVHVSSKLDDKKCDQVNVIRSDFRVYPY